MAKHVYLVVDCVTPLCGTMGVLRYEGLYEGHKELVKTSPTEFDYECPNCHQTHRYRIDQTRIELFDSAQVPVWPNGVPPIRH